MGSNVWWCGLWALRLEVTFVGSINCELWKYLNWFCPHRLINLRDWIRRLAISPLSKQLYTTDNDRSGRAILYDPDLVAIARSLPQVLVPPDRSVD